MLIRIGTAAQLLGVSTKTLRRWDQQDRLKPTLRTLGNHRRYESTTLNQMKTDPKPPCPIPQPSPIERVIGYVRVSSAKQRNDLGTQRKQLQQYAHEQQWHLEAIYQDIASGLNDRRPGLKRLVQTCQQGHIDRVLITYDDRLARFGTHLLEWLFQSFGVQLTRIHPIKLAKSLETQLFEDLLALMTSFTGRFHRLRRKQKPPDP